MPMPAFMFIDGMEGDVQIPGREGSVEVSALDHSVIVPVDVKDASATGRRVHNALVINKDIDRTSPLLLECVCTSRSIPTVEIRFYTINDEGRELEHYIIRMEKVRVVTVKTELPHVDYPENAQLKAREKVALRYDKITWLYTDGNIEFSDQVLTRV